MTVLGDAPDDHCPTCGYDLRGLVLRDGKACPECGARVDAWAQREAEDTRHVHGRLAWWAFVVVSPAAYVSALIAAPARTIVPALAAAWLVSAALCAVSLGRARRVRDAGGRARLWAWAGVFSFLYGALVLLVLVLASAVLG